MKPGLEMNKNLSKISPPPATAAATPVVGESEKEEEEATYCSGSGCFE